jgi:hypothetical protein
MLSLAILPPLTQFAATLAGIPTLAIVGHRMTCNMCPLALWLRTWYGVAVVVDEETVTLEGTEGVWESLPTPADYREFLLRVDYNGQEDPKVTAYEARTILAEIFADNR